MPSTTLNYTAAEGQRIAAAVGIGNGLTDASGNPRSGTLQECKDQLIALLRQYVRQQEQAVAMQAAQNSVTDISPT